MDSETSKVEVELTATEKLAQFEKEKLSRRQALARIGFQAGAAAVAALTADELLRKVGKEMQRRAGDNKIAQQVAKEFRRAGVANAVPLEFDDTLAPVCKAVNGCVGCIDTTSYCACKYDECIIGCIGTHNAAANGCLPVGSLNPACAGFNLCVAGCRNAETQCNGG